MKTLLILFFGIIGNLALMASIFGYTWGIVVFALLVISFFFIDWENMPWLKLSWKQ